MALIEDVNNKPGKHVAKNEYWKAEGETVVRCKLPFGDYWKVPPIVVDTKRDMQEFAMNLTSDHKRFKAAAELAASCDCKMVVLVENTDGIRTADDLAAWEEPEKAFQQRRKRNPKARRYSGATLAKTIATMHQRNPLLFFAFCSPEEAGAKVLEILRRG